MKHITREELILEFCKFTVDKMDVDTLKHIAMVTLCANIKKKMKREAPMLIGRITLLGKMDYIHQKI